MPAARTRNPRRRWRLHATLLAALTWTGALDSSGTTAGEPKEEPRYLSIDDLLAEETVHMRSTPAVSPDGAWVGLTVQGAHEERLETDSWFTRDGISGENLGCTLRLVHVPDGQVSQPFGEGVSVLAPAWSPDGAFLAAYVRDGGHGCLATWERATGKATLHHGFPVRCAIAWERPQWFPDSKAVLAHCVRTDLSVADETAPKEDGVYVNDPQKLLPPQEKKTAGTGTFAVLDVASKEVRSWWQGWAANIRISPDGRRVALSEPREALKERLGQSYAVVVADAADATKRVVVAEGLSGNWSPMPVWSPDGKKLAISYNNQWHAADLEAGERARLLPKPPAEAKLKLGADPVWRGDNAALCAIGANGAWVAEIATGTWKALNTEIGPADWLANATYQPPTYPDPDGCVLVRTRDRVMRLNLTTGEAQEICAAAPPAGARFLAADRSRAFGALWGFDLATGKQTPLIALKPGRPAKLLQPKTVEIAWDHAGKTCKGTAYLPHDCPEGARLPTILQIYPGRRDYPNHIQPPDLLVAQGFAVFLPEIPLSPTGGPLAETAAGAEAAADAAVKAGWADPDALGIMGHSYGGYAALCVAVSCKRFKAIAALSGFSHLSFAYPYMTGYFESGQGRMGGTYWDKKESYPANSPFERLPEVSAPLLLSSGSGMFMDNTEMWLAYLACTRLGKTVIFHEFAGAQHAPPAWPAHARRALAKALAEFFTRFLRPAGGGEAGRQTQTG